MANERNGGPHKRSKVEPINPSTRGVRRLQQFLGEEATMLVRSKTAVDVVPTLSSLSSSLFSAKKRKLDENSMRKNENSNSAIPEKTPVSTLLSPGSDIRTENVEGVIMDKVITHLQACSPMGSTRQISQSQCKAIHFLSSDVQPLTSAASLVSSPTAKGKESTKSASTASEGGQRILVKRVVLNGEREEEKIFDVITLAALQRAARITELKNASGGFSSTAASREEQQRGRCLFVLTNTNEQAQSLSHFLSSRYCMEVILADNKDVPSFPTLPASLLKGGVASSKGEDSSRTTTGHKNSPAKCHGGRSHGSPATTPPSLSTEGGDGAHTPLPISCPAWAAPVLVASPDGFLAIDPRSAVWRCIGAFVLLASAPSSSKKGKKGLITFSGGDSTRVVKLSQHRWACLGHTARTVVLASTEEAASHPTLDWLTSVKPSAEVLRAQKGEKASSPTSLSLNGTSTREEAASLTLSCSLPHAPGLPRAPVRVRYAVLEGLQRMQFLYALMEGLQPGRGMVVRVATREMCLFLFDVLYGLLEQLPPYVRVLTDYQGEREQQGDGKRAKSMVLSSKESQQLCEEFDEMVEEGRSAPVLFTCFGLVPRRGSIWLQFDVIEDIINYAQFLSTVVTPGAVMFSPSVASVSSPHPSSSSPTESTKGSPKGAMKEEKQGGHATSHSLMPSPSSPAVEVVRHTVSRKRSRSPVPLWASIKDQNTACPSPVSSAPSSASLSSSSSQTEVEKPAGGAPTLTPTNYAYVFILFRPSEVKPALQHLRTTGTRHALEFIPLAKLFSFARFLFVADKIRTFHRTLFHIQNAAYHAYKATMTVYCTLKPRDVYDEKRLELKKVAEEFGYEELPLLDLRLADTPFRPKEDYWKASRVKAAKDRRAMQTFAENYIKGEGPVPLEQLPEEEKR